MNVNTALAFEYLDIQSMTPYFGLAPDIRVYESLSLEQKCQRDICTLATLAIYTLADTYYVLGKYLSL